MVFNVVFLVHSGVIFCIISDLESLYTKKDTYNLKMVSFFVHLLLLYFTSFTFIMSSGFVQINGKILDVKDYQQKVILLKNYMKYRLEEELKQEGFELVRGRDSPALGPSLLFYNPDLDLQVSLKIKKKSRWAWV